MTEKRRSQDDRFACIEKMQHELRSAVAEIDGSIDRFQQEFQRLATAVHRLNLKHDSAKSLAQKQAAALDGLHEQLGRIEELVKRK